MLKDEIQWIGITKDRRRCPIKKWSKSKRQWVDANWKEKKNAKEMKLSFILRAEKDLNIKNYKEFVKSQQEEFNKNESKIIA